MKEWRKALYLLIIFFVFLGGYYFLMVYNYNKDIAEINENIKKSSQYIEEMKEQLENEQKQRTAFETNKYYNYIPKSNGMENILNFISQEAADKNINLLHVEINEKSQEDTNIKDIKPLTINLSLKGDYLKIRELMNDLYNGERLLSLIRWQVTGIGDKSDVNAYLTYNAYYFPNNNESFPELSPIQTYKPSGRLNLR